MDRHVRSAGWTARVVVFAVTVGLLGACSSSSREPDHAAAAARPGGQPTPTVGFDGQTIRLGELTALTGPERYVGLSVTAGSLAYFDALNTEKGGIAGKYKVYVDVHDTGGDVQPALQAFASMQTDDVLLAQLLGEDVVTNVLPSVRLAQMMAAPVLSGVSFRQDELLPIGVPVEEQAANALQWWTAKRAHPGRVCSLAQDSSLGDAANNGLSIAARDAHVTLGARVALPATAAPIGDLDVPLGRLRAAGCKAVVLMSEPAAAIEVLEHASAAQLDVQWIALSTAWTSALKTSPVIDYLRSHLVVVTEGPSWGDGSVPALREMQRIRVDYAPSSSPDSWFRYGYLQAEAVTALLEKAVARGDLSREGNLRASRVLGKVSFGGIAGSYEYGNAVDRVAPSTSSISRVDPDAPDGLTVETKAVEAPGSAHMLDPGD
jgi:ABC-type branched-subunit amino acid transport system substrate-binding protein